MNSTTIVILILVLFIALWVASAYIDRKRAEAIKAVAQAIGLEFYQQGTDLVMPIVCDFQLFNRGRSKRVKNLMQGEIRHCGMSIAISVFDYYYTTGSGKNRSTHSQTALLIRSELLGLPQFSLTPENLLHKIGELFGLRDIDFAVYPEFSKKYLLQGKDEPQIFHVFQQNVIAFYEARRVCTEASGSRLLYYRPHSVVHPQDIRTLISEGLTLFDALRQSG